MGRRIATLIPLTALLAGLTAGCGEEQPAGDRLEAALVTFEPDARVRVGTAELEQLPDKPDRSYVQVTATTGCRLADSAELTRDGDDLRVRFTGGQDHEECVRPYNALARFELATAQVEGVKTVLGKEPLPGAGPAKLTGFVQLGPISRASIDPVELRGNAGQTLYAALQHARASNLGKARVVLQRTPTAGQRAYAYVLTGCAETGAQLIVDSRVLRAELIGDKTVCVAAAYFLATFEIPAKLVPAGATPR